jgi:hypothetical protein
VSWRLDELGWLQFEELCQALLKTNVGLGLEAWGNSGDHGKDAYFDGPLRFPRKDQEREGPFVFQAKFVANANSPGARPRTALMNAVRSERRRISTRLAKGQWSKARQYVLLTNVPLTSELRRAVTDEIHKVLPGIGVHVQGFRDLGAMLDDAPQIRMSYPQILGLRDLRLLLREQGLAGLVNRSRFSMDLAVSKARVFVRTDAYVRARSGLDRHHFVVLTGAPEVGKTTIARMLALGALTDGWEVYECRKPRDLFDAYVADSRQVFIADDAFGSTEFRPDQAHEWGDEMERILHALDAKHLLIWTSRPAILNAALDRMHLQGEGEAFPDTSAVKVDVSRLSELERALMIYRHARDANLPEAARDLIRQLARQIVSHEHFTPQRIALFMKDGMAEVVKAPAEMRIETVSQQIQRRIGEPTKQMRQSLEALPAEHRDVLVTMLDAGVGDVSLGKLEAAYERFGGHGDLRSLIEDLEGHFLRIFTRPGTTETAVDWLHPSWRDLMIERLASRSDDRHEFLRKCGVEGLFLTLSVEGGATGARNLPLLPGAEEVTIARDQIRRIVYGEPDQTARVVNLAQDLAFGLRGSALGRSEALVEPLLLACQELWDETGAALTVGNLKAWWSASTAVTPLPHSPRLESTWIAQDLRGELDADMELFDHSPNALKLRNWVRLVRLIQSNEPRFLRQLDFPDSYDEVWDAIFGAAQTELESEWDVSGAEEYEGWAEALTLAADTVETCVEFKPALAERAQGLVPRLREASDDKTTAADEERQRQEERGQELAEEYEDEPWGDEPEETAPPLTVEAVLADL